MAENRKKTSRAPSSMPKDGICRRRSCRKAENLPIKPQGSSGWPTAATPLRRVWYPFFAKRRLWTTPRIARGNAVRPPGSKPKAEQPQEGNTPAHGRLSHMQNGLRASPGPQGGPKSLGLSTGTARLPNAEPGTAFGGQQTTASPELPNPVARRATVRQECSRAPLPDTLALAQNRVQARLDNLRGVALERNAERREKADRDPTARTPTPHLTDLNPVYLGKPDIPEICALAFRTRVAADRTGGRNLLLYLRIVGRVGLNRVVERRK